MSKIHNELVGINRQTWQNIYNVFNDRIKVGKITYQDGFWVSLNLNEEEMGRAKMWAGAMDIFKVKYPEEPINHTNER